MGPTIDLEPTVLLTGPLWLVAAAVLIGTFFLTRKRPDYGLALVLAALPLYQVRGDLGLPTTLLELILGAVLLGVATRWRSLRWQRTPYDVWILLWLLAGLVNTFVTPGDGLKNLALWRAFFLEPVLYFYAAVAVFRRYSPLPLLWGALAALGVVAAWSSLLLFDNRAMTYDGRFRGCFQSPNFLAMFTAPLLLMIAAWPERRLWLLRSVTFAAGLAMLIASGSRGGQVALLAGVVVLVLWRIGRRHRLAIAGLAVTAGLLSVYGASQLADRTDKLVSPRPVIWEQTLDMLKKRPLTGTGSQYYQTQFLLQVQTDPNLALRYYVTPYAISAHNLWLTTWVHWGLFALLGLLGILVVFGVRAMGRLGDPWTAVGAAAMTAIVVHGLIDTPLYKNDLAVLFILPLVLSLVLVVKSKQT